jgi:hypothetical protein
VSKQEGIGDRNEWRTLPRRGDIAYAEIAHDIDPGALCDHGRLSELPRRVAGLVPDGLPVACDCRYRRAPDACLRHGGDRCFCEPVAEIERQPAILAGRRPNERLRQPIPLRRVVGPDAHA